MTNTRNMVTRQFTVNTVTSLVYFSDTKSVEELVHQEIGKLTRNQLERRLEKWYKDLGGKLVEIESVEVSERLVGLDVNEFYNSGTVLEIKTAE